MTLNMSPRHVLLACFAASLSLHGHAADNQEVLRQWAAASGQPAPQVIKQEDGSTRLSWTHQTTVDAYQASASGGDMLTPVRDGTFGRLQWHSDTRREKEGDALDWLMFGVDVSNDPAVLQHDLAITTLQAGRSTQTYRVAFGDVPVDHSSLGTRGEMRGIFVERSLGDSLVSGAAGVQTESWHSLAAKSRRMMPLRDAYALKLATPLGKRFNVYATAQGFSDHTDSVAFANQLTPVERARAATVGLDYNFERWKFGAEAGAGDWRAEGEAEQNDRAFILDGSWQGERATARVGHHDIGLYYASLSADVVPGVRETYVDGNWRATDTLALAAGVRRTRNAAPIQVALAEQGPQSRQSDSHSLAATLDVTAVKGLQLQASQAGSRGHNFDQGALRNRSHGLSVRYPIGSFDTGLGWQRAKLVNASTPLSDANTTTWNTSLGWSNASNQSRIWQFAASTQFSLQRQHFTSGTHNTNRALSLSLDVGHPRWGNVRASGQVGRLRNTSTGNVLGRSVQLDATHDFGSAGSVKLYARNGRTSASGVAASYVERVIGLQWLLAAE